METKSYGVLCNVFGKERWQWLFAYNENDAKNKTLNTPGFYGANVLKVIQDDSHIVTFIL
jgi:hypothetical protein